MRDWTHIALCVSVIAIGAAGALHMNSRHAHPAPVNHPAPVSCPIYSDVADLRAEHDELAARVSAIEHSAADETGRDGDQVDARADALRCALQHLAERACRVNAQGRTRCLPERTPWPGWDDWDRCEACGYGRDCNTHGGPTHGRGTP